VSTEEKKARRCPCCDIIALAGDKDSPLSVIETLALGASIGALVGDLNVVSRAMCDKHSFPWLLACLSGIERLQALQAKDGPAEPEAKPQPDRSLS
jgi:hypothetical protein